MNKEKTIADLAIEIADAIIERCEGRTRASNIHKAILLGTASAMTAILMSNGYTQADAVAMVKRMFKREINEDRN